MISIRDVRFIVVDVETTGSSPTKNRITEIGCVEIMGRDLIDEYSSLINPHQNIPPFISKMTGITNEMVFTAPEPKDALTYVKKMVDKPNTVFVAHNVHFDWGFVLESFKRAGLYMPEIPLLCTFKLAKKVLNGEVKKNVGSLANFFQIPIINRHRALDDAKATGYILIEFLELLQNEYQIENLDELIKFQNSRNKKTKLKATKKTLFEKVKSIPDEHGVYYFLNKENKPIYIGKANSIIDRVRQHLNESDHIMDKTSEMVRMADDIKWATTNNELEALILESKEIKKHKPKYNAVQKKFKQYPFIKITNDKYPTIEKCYEIIDDDSEYFGPFRSKKLVTQIIENINNNFRLKKCDIEKIENMLCDKCFYFQINKCIGPKTGNFAEKEYNEELNRAKLYLRSFNNSIISDMTQKMNQLSENLDFESANYLKNNINELKVILSRQKDVSTSVRDNNLILIIPDIETPKLLDLYFIKQGFLFNQITLGKKAPLNKAYELTQKAFFNGSHKKSNYSLEDIDEMKIVNSWIYKQKDIAKFIYIENKSQEEIFTEIEQEFH